MTITEENALKSQHPGHQPGLTGSCDLAASRAPARVGRVGRSPSQSRRESNAKGRHAGTKTFPALTGLRAIAASMVFFLHNSEMFLPWGKEAYSLAKELHVAVPIFFGLSGFLITYRYYESKFASWHSWKRYLQNRFARIYPSYILITLFTLIMYQANDIGVWISSLFMAKGFFANYELSGMRQAWSLSVEENFYLLAPILFALLTRFRVAVVLLLVYAAGGLLTWVGIHLRFHGFMGSAFYNAQSTFFGHAYTFLAGTWLALSLVSARNRGRLFALIQRIPATYVGISGILCLICVLTRFQNPGYWGNANGNWTGLLIQAVTLPPLIVVLLYGLIHEKTIVSKILSTRLMDLLGKSSYLFYLIHYGPMPTLLQRFMPRIGVFVAIWGISVLIYLLYEKPLHRLLAAKSEQPLEIRARSRASARHRKLATLMTRGLQ